MPTATWKGQLTFGLVSFPVKLYPAARRETIHFRQLHRPDHSPVKQVLYCQLEDRPVPREELVRGYEYERDRFVILEDSELKAIEPKSSKVMEIVQFVRLDQVDPVYLEAAYYLHPDQAGEKPYQLLLEALRKTGYGALARLTMHNREHLVMLRPGRSGITLHTLYYQDEVRALDEFRPQQTEIQPKELELAVMLVEALAGEFRPEQFKDSYREQLQKLIEAKVRGEKVVEMPVERRMAPVIDIMEALKASLAQVKKPPVSAPAPSTAAPQVQTPAAVASARVRKTRKRTGT